MTQVLIIGGGIAGLISSILLSRAGITVLLLEKGSYPAHRVCGEYVSNEVINFLKSIDAYPDVLNPSVISRLLISSTSGSAGEIDLDLGGFGVSRHAFDHFLYQRAKEEGAEIKLMTNVVSLEASDSGAAVLTSKGERFEAQLLLSTHGKRSRVDSQLNRDFTKKRAPFIGVKYHLKGDLPSDLIALHNFKGGYCGVVKVEGDKFNLCYLSSRENLKKFKSIRTLEEQILYRNPRLKDLFLNSDFLFEKSDAPFVPKTERKRWRRPPKSLPIVENATPGTK